MRKGSYSEELVKIVRFHVCSRNATGAVDLTTATSDHGTTTEYARTETLSDSRHLSSVRFCLSNTARCAGDYTDNSTLFFSHSSMTNAQHF